jgi:cytidine deaminase
MNDIPWTNLIAAAERARQNAYAPYSNYQVGAALLGPDGRIFAGCNVENVSYGLALCAERGAVAQLVAAGGHDITALVVVTAGPEPGAPCGLCRQTLVEFADDLPIALVVTGEASPRMIKNLRDLFPEPFRADLAKR